MTKVFSLAIVHAPTGGPSTVLNQATDLSSFSFYQRGTVSEFMGFMSRTVVERTQPGQRQSVKEKNYTAHVDNKGGPGQLAGIMITEEGYPLRAAFSLLTRVLDDFATKVPLKAYEDPGSIVYEIQGWLLKAQDPTQMDVIGRVQAELDETKIILHKTIESVLERGEKLDNIVERSNALSIQSKMFYKTAKKQNSCCVIM